MRLKTLVVILCTLIAAVPASLHGEEGKSVFPGPSRVILEALPTQEISPRLHQSIFVPLAQVDPTEAERTEYLKRGKKALERGEMKQAQALFHLALMLDIRDVRANLSLGNMLFQAKQYLKAGEHFRRVLKEDPNHVEALLNMGKINFILFKRTEAFEFFQEVAELNPGNLEATKYINYILGEDQVKDSLPEEYYTIPYSQALTRGELAALVYFRTDKLKAIITPPQPQIITDIGDSWADKYIKEVAKYRVMEVYPNHTFQHQAVVNRGEFAQVIMNLLQGLGLYKVYRENLPKKKLVYEDIDPFNNYYEAVRLVTDLGIIRTGRDRNFNLGQTVSGQGAVEYFDHFDRAVRLLRANR